MLKLSAWFNLAVGIRGQNQIVEGLRTVHGKEFEV